MKSKSELRRLVTQKGSMYNNGMTGEKHAVYIADEARKAIFEKYNAGQKEHGGKLWRKVITPHILEEAIDQIVYILTLRDQLRAAESKLALGLATRDWQMVEEGHSILATGNPDGGQEEERNP